MSRSIGTYLAACLPPAGLTRLGEVHFMEDSESIQRQSRCGWCRTGLFAVNGSDLEPSRLLRVATVASGVDGSSGHRISFLSLRLEPLHMTSSRTSTRAGVFGARLTSLVVLLLSA